MRKISVIMAVAASFALTACGAKKDVDINALTTSLQNEIVYSDELSEIPMDTALNMIYSFGDIEIPEAHILESSGATAEEIAVIKCANESDIEAVKSVLNDRIAEQKESFEDYVPEELNKLDAAVVYTSGCVAVLSVSDEPEKAKSIIESYVK